MTLRAVSVLAFFSTTEALVVSSHISSGNMVAPATRSGTPVLLFGIGEEEVATEEKSFFPKFENPLADTSGSVKSTKANKKPTKGKQPEAEKLVELEGLVSVDTKGAPLDHFLASSPCHELHRRVMC